MSSSHFFEEKSIAMEAAPKEPVYTQSKHIIYQAKKAPRLRPLTGLSRSSKSLIKGNLPGQNTSGFSQKRTTKNPASKPGKAWINSATLGYAEIQQKKISKSKYFLVAEYHVKDYVTFTLPPWEANISGIWNTSLANTLVPLCPCSRRLSL